MTDSTEPREGWYVVRHPGGTMECLYHTGEGWQWFVGLPGRDNDLCGRTIVARLDDLLRDAALENIRNQALQAYDAAQECYEKDRYFPGEKPATREQIVREIMKCLLSPMEPLDFNDSHRKRIDAEIAREGGR